MKKSKKIQVLLLEDSTNDAELIKEELAVLAEFTFDYVQVDNKKDFIHQLENHDPDIVLSDFKLPQYDGLSALNDLKKIGKNIPFIFVTGTLTEEVAADSIKSGAWDYVVKERLFRLPSALINAIKLKEEKEKKMEAEFQLKIHSGAVQQAPVSICITDKEGGIQYVNPKFEHITGYTPAEVAGKKLSIIFSGSYSNNAYEEIRLLLLKGGEWKGVLKNQKKNGTIYWGNTSINSIRDEKNEIRYFIATMEDITTQKLAEEALQKSEEKYKMLIDNQGEGIVIANEKGEFNFANPAAESIFGVQRGELLHKSLKQFTSSEDFNRIQKVFIDSENEEKSSFELEIIRPDGKKRVILVTATPNMDEHSNVRNTFAIFRDITERKQMEEQLIKAKEKAEESDRLKTAFLANMSHEIRTPMNGIIGFSDILAKEELNKQKIETYTQVIKTCGNQLLSIVNDLIDISIIEAGQLKIEKREIDINHLMDNIYQMLKARAEVHGLDLQLKKNSNKTLWLYSDEHRLQQILINLINNALKYTDKGKVEFGYQIKNHSLEFYVKDTGIGISKTNQQLIFDRFRQVESSNARLYGGAGLGLSISKSLVELLGGNIWVDSQKEQGSTFYFSIPYQEKKVAPVKAFAKDENQETFDWQNKTILIVEDDDDNLLFLQEVLEHTQINIISVRNGEDAVKVISQNPEIHAVLMDIKIPVMNGYEATRKIKRIRKEIPIIAQTAYARHEDKVLCLEAGCDAYLAKPIAQEELLILLKTYLNTGSFAR